MKPAATSFENVSPSLIIAFDINPDVNLYAKMVRGYKSGGFNVGGEQSGHMILSDHATTGDGTLAALQVLAELTQGAFQRATGFTGTHHAQVQR